jgi:hypothetical protein
MIRYKPSARLGLLNTEDFTSNPAPRGWTVTGDAPTYGAGGATLTTANSWKTATFELVNTSLNQFLSIRFYSYESSGDYTHDVSVAIYLNDTLVRTSAITSSILDAKGIITIHKNKDNEWVVFWGHGWESGSGGRGGSSAGNAIPSFTANAVNKIKIVFATKSGFHARTINSTITNLKWV